MSASNVRLLLTANAVVGLATGVGLILVPDIVLSLLGLRTDSAGTVAVRLYGGELIGFNVATWGARSAPSPRGGIVVGHVANESLTAIILVAAALTGLGSVLVWGFALVAAAFALGFLIAALTG